MPSYKITSKGFIGGKTYSPEGKRNVYTSDKAFPSKNKVEQVPSWMERIKDETPAQASARKGAATKAAKAAEKKAAEDTKAIEDASFLGDGESTTTTVETL